MRPGPAPRAVAARLPLGRRGQHVARPFEQLVWRHRPDEESVREARQARLVGGVADEEDRHPPARHGPDLGQRLRRIGVDHLRRHDDQRGPAGGDPARQALARLDRDRFEARGDRGLAEPIRFVGPRDDQQLHSGRPAIYQTLHIHSVLCGSTSTQTADRPWRRPPPRRRGRPRRAGRDRATTARPASGCGRAAGQRRLGRAAHGDGGAARAGRASAASWWRRRGRRAPSRASIRSAIMRENGG